jgi:hypothetical protein
LVEALRGLTADEYGDFVASNYQIEAQAAAQAQRDERQAELTREGWRFEEGARRRAADAAAPLRSPYYEPLNSRDQQTHQGYQQAAASGELAMQRIQNARQLLMRLAEMGETGQPIEARLRMPINRLLGDNKEAIGLYEEFQTQQWPLVLEALQGLQPVSNVEISMAMRATPGVDNQLSAALASLEALESRTRQTVDLSYRGMDWGSNSGSYSAGRDAQGQTWANVQRDVFTQQPGGGRGAALSGGPGPAAPPPSAFGDALGVAQIRAITQRDPRSLPNGYEFEIAGAGRYRIRQLRVGTQAERVTNE